jgi:RNA polymerase sigma-70 factor (ECF subfamily)
VFALLRTAIAGLPPTTRDVFLRARVQNQGYAQIARELGMSLRTVERRMAEAMAVLCDRLRDAP